MRALCRPDAPVLGALRSGWLFAAAVLLSSASATAQPSGVASTLHNLSVTGPGEVKAATETEICKFCHIPHNATVPRPLWGHVLSDVGQYAVPRLRGGGRAEAPAPQPDGASRMCLSCHDGTVALGKIVGQGEPVRMAGAQHLRPGRPGYLGTDLSGSHPISFVLPDGDPGDADGASDMGFRPRSVVESAEGVPLDKQGKMQCTTCHDPHSDRYYQPGKVPHFWTRPTVEEVCLTCHVPR